MENNENLKDIRKELFDLNQPFFNSVASMFILTWKTGFSLQNITFSGNTKILSSPCKFHLYFHFKRFQKQPLLLKKYLNENELKPLDDSTEFKRFIKEKSNGFHSLGQNLFLKLIEAFCFLILGAQADTRFSIVNQEQNFYKHKMFFIN